MTRDPRIDAYIERAAPFARPILAHARALVHQACPQVEETIKWGMPTFVHAGGILCGMAAFKQHASFGFWKHALVVGEGEPRDGMGSYGKMLSLDDFPAKKIVLAHIRNGKLRALAVTGKERLAALPDVPTATEAGVPGFEATSWTTVAVSSKVPQAVVEKISADVRSVVNTPEFRKGLEDQGMSAVANSLADATRFVTSEKTRWDRVIQEGRVSAD